MIVPNVLYGALSKSPLTSIAVGVAVGVGVGVVGGVGVAVGVGVGPPPLVTLTLSRSKSIFCVAGEMSVKVRVVELLFAVKVNAFGVKAVPVPMPKTDISWLRRVVPLPTTVTLTFCSALLW